MPTKSTIKPPRFKSEAEEADWYHTPEGKRHSDGMLQKARLKGRIIVEEKISMRKAMDVTRAGKTVVLKKGVGIKATDPAVLKDLADRLAAKQTQAVSLRLPVRDIGAAKKLAAQMGLGYQTVLKEIIGKALHGV